MSADRPHDPYSIARGMTRRDFLGVSGALAVGAGLGGTAYWFKRCERGWKADVLIGKADDYNDGLFAVIDNGLRELGITRETVRGKRILLKPNLVETAIDHQHINTHPAVVAAVAEAFRRRDAADVFVAEGQGHRRDSWLVLEESGMRAALDEARLDFVDLNHDAIAAVANDGGWMDLEQLHLPQTLRSADWIVSLPKLKTHHWAGMTCAMKNLFGVMPGIVYGWPKNVLHYQGIPAAILDINATVRPTLAIVDGIVGMEGDGPIMGEPKPFGAVVMGRNPVAVDATCARLMELNPRRIEYLRKASGRLGPIQADNINQRGEAIATLAQPFRLLDVPHLADLRAG